MSRFKLVLSKQAETDLVDIWVYIAEDSPAMADDFINKIQEKCFLLAENPHLGRARPELAKELFSFPFKRYVIYYRKRGGRIEIARILSAYRDLDSLL